MCANDIQFGIKGLQCTWAFDMGDAVSHLDPLNSISPWRPNIYCQNVRAYVVAIF